MFSFSNSCLSTHFFPHVQPEKPHLSFVHGSMLFSFAKAYFACWREVMLSSILFFDPKIPKMGDGRRMEGDWLASVSCVQGYLLLGRAGEPGSREKCPYCLWELELERSERHQRQECSEFKASTKDATLAVGEYFFSPTFTST